MIEEYKKHEQERAAQNIPPLPLTADQTSDLVELLKDDHSEAEFLMELLWVHPLPSHVLKLHTFITSTVVNFACSYVTIQNPPTLTH